MRKLNVKECDRSSSLINYFKNREAKKEQMLKYAAQHREIITERSRQWRKDNKQYSLEYAKEYYKKNREKIRLKAKLKRLKNKGKL